MRVSCPLHQWQVRGSQGNRKKKLKKKVYFFVSTENTKKQHFPQKGFSFNFCDIFASESPYPSKKTQSHYSKWRLLRRSKLELIIIRNYERIETKIGFDHNIISRQKSIQSIQVYKAQLALLNHEGSSINDLTVLVGGGGQGFCDNSTKTSVIKSMMIGGGQKIFKIQ